MPSGTFIKTQGITKNLSGLTTQLLVLHVMCAMLGVLCDNSLPTRTAPRLILSHVSRGLHLVNKQIESASYPSASSPTSGSTAMPVSDAAPPTLPNHTESAVSDTTIASILLLSIYERLRGDYDRADVHLRGLKRIADLRGVISTLYTTKGLASKICRADIDLALHFGRKTVFSATETRTAMSIQSGGCGSSGGQLDFLLGDGKAKASRVAAVEERPEEHGIVAQLSPKYAELMRDLLRMARFLNSTAGVPVLDVYGCEALLVNLCYRVVELRPLRHSNAIAATSRSTTPRRTARDSRDIPPPATDNMQTSAIPSLSPAPTSSHSQPPPPSSLVSNIDDAAHLGAAAFATTLLLEFSQQLVTHELLRTSLRTSIQRLVSSGVQNLRAALWLCFVGGVSVFKLALNTILAKPMTAAAATATPAVADDDATWLLPQIHELCQDLGLENWSDVLSLLGGEFPWVHSLHDGPAKALWDATVAMATSSGRTGSSASVEPTQTSLIWDSLSGIPCEKIHSKDRPQPPPFKLKPLQTLSHEPGVTLSHPQYGVW